MLYFLHQRSILQKLEQYLPVNLHFSFISLIASKVCREELNQSQKLWATTRWAEIQVMTKLIKKRVGPELFIDRKRGLFIQKECNKRTKKLYDLIEEGKIKQAWK